MQHYWQIYLHVVWGTKGRSHILRGPGEIAVHAAIRKAARDHELVPICVNSAWNHTHSLISWSLELGVREVVETFKKKAVDAWDELRGEPGSAMPKLEWQDGFAAFSVSRRRVQPVKKYVARQKDRHRNNKTIPHFEKWCILKSKPDRPEPQPATPANPQPTKP